MQRLASVRAHLRAQSASAATPAAAEDPLADLETHGLVQSYRRDGFVVVKGFLAGDDLRQHQEELQRYVAEVVPTKSTDDVYFDGEWSAAGPHAPWAVPFLCSGAVPHVLQTLPFCCPQFDSPRHGCRCARAALGAEVHQQLE